MLNDSFSQTVAIIRSWLFSAMVIIVWPQSSAVTVTAQEEIISRIAFGSCANQQKPCPIWFSIADYRPQLLLLLGDNVYADVVAGRLVPSTPERIAEAYQQLADDPGFAKLRSQTSILATWDDHDFGNNDAGREWEHKEVAARLFHDFFGTPADSDRRQQEGVYHSQIFGPPGRRVQVIMLDTRYFRSPLERSDQALPGWRSRPYMPATGSDATMLGQQQWSWLEEQLKRPAEIRIIGSSIQLISDEHPFEKWGNFPDERQRLYDLIRSTGAGGVLVISGDRHLGDISLEPNAIGYPLFDATASGLNQANNNWRPTEPNSRRVAALQYGNHFGCIEIDWLPEDPIIRMQLRHEDGELAVQTHIPLSVLQAGEKEQALPDGVVTARKARTMAPGTMVTVRYRVMGGREFPDTGRILLNSHRDFRDESNLTVVVNPEALVDDTQDVKLDFFMGKEIEVSGVLSVFRDQPQIVVDTAQQLKIIE